LVCIFDSTILSHEALAEWDGLESKSDDIGPTLLDEKEFETVEKAEATTVVYSKDGISNHSAKKNGDKYTYTDGYKATKTGNENDASINGKYNNPKYTKEKVRTFNTGPKDEGTTKIKGIRLYEKGARTDFKEKKS
jgi:hypothetical protein